MSHAQMIAGPPGSVGGLFGGHRPVDPNRTSQTLEANLDLSGGYDRDPNVLRFSPIDAPDLTRWYATTGAASARYRVGSIRRSLDARGRVYVNYQSNAGDALVGGEGVLNGAARFGQRRLNQLTMEVESSYEPGWVFGAFGSRPGLGAEEPAIGVAPPQGVFEQRWLVLAGTGGYEQHWSARHVTTLHYSNRRLRPVEGDGLESDFQVASVEQAWAAQPSLTVLGAYRVNENVQRDEGVDIPAVRYQTVDAGFRYERRLSPLRRYAITLRAGATRLLDAPASGPASSLQPSLTGTLEVVPSLGWSLSVDATRGVMVMAGVSPVPVVNDTLAVTLNGTPTRRLRYSLYGSLSRAEFLTPDITVTNTTDVAGATLEVRYATASWSAAFVTYSYYHHRFDDPTLVASGFPPRYDRHSVRVGMSFWLPLYGAF